MSTKVQLEDRLLVTQAALDEAKTRDFRTCDIKDALDHIEDRIFALAHEARDEASLMEEKADELDTFADDLVTIRHQNEGNL